MARHRRTPTKDAEGREDQWNLPDFVHGFIRARNGIATLYYSNHKHSLGIPFEQRLKSRAVKLGTEWVRQLKKNRAAGLPASGIATTAPKAMTVQRAWAEFLLARVDRLSAKRREHYDTAAKAFAGAKPLPLDRDTLHTHLVAWLASERARGLAHNTIAQKCSCLTTFFRYCQNRGILTGNPIAETGAPTMKPRDKVNAYSERDIERVYQRLRTTAEAEPRAWHRVPREQAAIAWLFFYYTGMREGEMLRLRWEQVEMHGTPDDMIVLEKTKTGRDRFFPLAPFPEVRALLEELRPHAKRNGGKLFLWQKPEHLLAKITAALRAEGIAYSNQPVHAMRASCAQRLRKLGIGEDYIPTIIGNDRETYRRFYKDLPVEELSETVKRVRGERAEEKNGTMA